MKKYLTLFSVLISILGLNASVSAAAPKYTKTPSGLEIADETKGKGATAKAKDTVEVHYTGKLLDGDKPTTQFDSSVGRGPFKFVLGAGQVIPGWDEGVAGMKEGGKRHLRIPAKLAYGDRDMGPIPANSRLYFVVELLKVNPEGK